MENNLNTVDICTAFGHFIKFTVSLGEPGVISSLDVSKNAFEIMMQNQRCISKPTLLNVLVEQTKKDKLFNDLLRLVEKGLKFSPGQLESGKSYLTTVTSALWCIDHHQSTLSDRGCEILFKGYNTPSLSKHRKWEHTSLSAYKLATHVVSLYAVSLYAACIAEYSVHCCLCSRPAPIMPAISGTSGREA